MPSKQNFQQKKMFDFISFQNHSVLLKIFTYCTFYVSQSISSDTQIYINQCICVD